MDISGIMSSSGKNNNNSSSYYAATLALLKSTMSSGGGGTASGGTSAGGGGGGSSSNVGGGGGSSSSSSAQHRPKFVIPVPPVPHEIQKAVREQSHSKEKAQIRQLHAQWTEQRRRVQVVESEIAELERSKLDATRRLEAESRRQAQIACDKVEAEARAQYEIDKARRREEWRRKIEEECERNFREGAAGAVAATTVVPQAADPSNASSSQPSNTGDGAADSTTEGPDGLDRTSTEPQDAPHHDDQSASKDSVPVLPLPPSELLLAAEADERAASSHLAVQIEMRQEAQQNLDKLQEKRGEIAWLLKQVIKAEQKAKAKQQQQQEPAQPDSK